MWCEDASLGDCSPTFRDSTVDSFSRVEMFKFLFLKAKQCVVSTGRAKITQCRIATSKRNGDINCTAAGMPYGDLYLYFSILFHDFLNLILLRKSELWTSVPHSFAHSTLTNSRFALVSVSTPSKDVNGRLVQKTYRMDKIRADYKEIEMLPICLFYINIWVKTKLYKSALGGR